MTSLNRMQFAVPELIKHSSVVILSACRAQLSIARNEMRTRHLEDIIKNTGLSYRQVLGFFREDGEEHGCYESSFMVFVNDLEQARKLCRIATVQFQQDCVLVATNFGADADYKAYLMDYNAQHNQYGVNAIGKLDWDYAQQERSAFTVTHDAAYNELYIFAE